MNKRQLLGTYCSKLRLLPILKLIDARRDSLKILAYHRVMDVDPESYLFDLNLVDASVEDFSRQMQFLAKNFSVMSLSNGVAEFKAGTKKKIAVVTFDDGFSDLYHNVFPILKRFNIPATIFLTTGFIDTDNTLWSEKIVYAIKIATHSRRILKLRAGECNVDIDLSDRDKGIDKTLIELKLVPDDIRKRLISSIFQQLEVDEVFGHADGKMLSWDQIKEMAAWGVEFGSHTVSHPVLLQLNQTEINKELGESKQVIEAKLDAECNTIAYPVGGEDAFDENIMALTKKHGYKIGCSYLSGINYRETLNLFALKRIHIDRTVNFDWFKAQVICPAVCAANVFKDK